MKKNVNMAYVAQGALCVLLGLCLLWLCLTRVYLQYVTPRTLPYLYFAAALMLVTGLYAFARVHTRAHVKHYLPLLMLLIPLLLIGYSTHDANQWGAPLFPMVDSETVDPQLQQQTYTMTIPAFENRVLHGYNEQAQTIYVLEDETYWWLSEIYNNPQPFLGYTIHTMGQVLTDPAFFPEGCFSPARKLMTCCVADLFTIGFKCQYDDVQSLKEGEWVTVTGKLAMVNLEESQELRLVVDTVTAANPPAEPYVYAY